VSFTRATITLPPDLLKSVDRLARRTAASRSAVIAGALRSYLARPGADAEGLKVAEPNAGRSYLAAALLSGVDNVALVQEVGRRLGSGTVAVLGRPAGSPRLRAEPARLAEVCRRHHIRKLALFGSVLTDEFRDGSDVDVLVEFEPGHTPGFGLTDIEDELSAIFGGRRIDLLTAPSLHPRIRDRVLATAMTQYAA
jgi:predicted nucleotidyltransferase/predicted transcriptional regulator